MIESLRLLINDDTDFKSAGPCRNCGQPILVLGRNPFSIEQVGTPVSLLAHVYTHSSHFSYCVNHEQYIAEQEDRFVEYPSEPDERQAAPMRPEDVKAIVTDLVELGHLAA